MGRAHEKQCIRCLCFDAKKYENLYKILPDGYTINVLKYSTAGYYQNRQQDLTYLIHIKEISFSKDTRFFTSSITHRHYSWTISRTRACSLLYKVNC